jgi:hypothetical protein
LRKDGCLLGEVLGMEYRRKQCRRALGQGSKDGQLAWNCER